MIKAPKKSNPIRIRSKHHSRKDKIEKKDELYQVERKNFQTALLMKSTASDTSKITLDIKKGKELGAQEYSEEDTKIKIEEAGKKVKELQKIEERIRNFMEEKGKK